MKKTVKKIKKENIPINTNVKIGSKKNVFLVKHAAITEKSSFLTNQNKYVFVVDPKANKSEVAKIVRSIYKVEPISVNIVNIKGKKKRFGTKTGRLPDIKKAIVTLKKGQKIEIMPV